MGLSKDIEDALVKSLGPDAVGKGNIPELAIDISNAVVKFLQAQTFQITEMKAILEVEDMKTTSTLSADVLPSVTTMVPPGVPTAGSPAAQFSTAPAVGNVTQGVKGVMIPPINIAKKGGQGGQLISKGYSYIGNNPVSRTESNVDKTKVKLLKVVDK